MKPFYREWQLPSIQAQLPKPHLAVQARREVVWGRGQEPSVPRSLRAVHFLPSADTTVREGTVLLIVNKATCGHP